ncbi:MAG: hypothetical protein DRH24_08795 [Deltaproteobacteria bacterium]|nr:MAG: hypothetical protein DRH24_08795 [Deltaproteobacteria bacterium]
MVYKLQRVVEQQNQIIAELKQAKPAEQPKPDQQPEDKSQIIEQKIAEIEKREERARQRTLQVALREAAGQAGVPESLRPVLADWLPSKANLNIEEDGSVVYQDAAGVKQPLNEYLGEFLKTDQGRAFLPEVKTATTEPMTPQRAAALDPAQMTTEQRAGIVAGVLFDGVANE